MTASDAPEEGGLTPFQRGALWCLRAYKVLLSPLFAGSCRFVPSCSEYAAGAVREYGVARGSWLAARRLAKCQPFGPYGFDPVCHASVAECAPATARPPQRRHA